MSTQAQSSQHLSAARELLDGLAGTTDEQAQAGAATAHAILVLAEQVAATRLVMHAEAVTQHAGGEAAG